MSSLTNALNISNSALRFNQNALSVVSNNVANANTVGYTRQVITSETQVMNGQGQGVSSGTISRYSNQVLQTNMDQQNSNLSYNQTVSEFLSTIESQFGKLSNGDNNTSLDSQISDMFSQVNNLIQNPSLSSNRVTFLNSTTQTVGRLNTLADGLSNTQISIDNEITTDLDAINAALKNINDLNGQIKQVETANGNSSNLKDLRQAEINKVSKYLQVETKTKEDGVIHLTLNSGKVLVDSTYAQLTRTEGSPYGGIGFNRVVADGKLSNSVQILNSDDLTSGSIGGMVALRDEQIPNLLAQLDNFAVNFIQEFNNIHAQGSAVPPPSSLVSAQQPSGGSTLLADLGLKAGTDFDISVVNSSGSVVSTTAQTDYTGSLTGSTIAGTSTGSFDVAAYLAANGESATVEGASSLEYLGSNMYRLTDAAGGVYTANISPATYPVGATPATLNFGNGISLNVDTGTTEPTVGNIGTIDTNITSGPVRIEAGDTIDDLAAKINANSTLSGSVTATVVNGALQLTSVNPNNGVVLGNDPTGDTFNKLGFNRFFEGDSASTMAVLESVKNDTNNIATARMSEDGRLINTNNENAVALLELQNKSFTFASAGGLNSQDSTLTDYFVSITSSFAANVSANEQQQEFNQVLYNDFYSRVQSESGVNTDEEFSNLIIYQKSFEAAARMISIVDDMLENLINMV
jgi:flagellar hook-associated protein 1